MKDNCNHWTASTVMASRPHVAGLLAGAGVKDLTELLKGVGSALLMQIAGEPLSSAVRVVMQCCSAAVTHLMHLNK